MPATSPGWHVRSGPCLVTETLLSGRMTWNCTMQPQQTWKGASDRPSWIITTKYYLQNNNLRQLWLGVQNITNYNPRHRAVDGDVVLAEMLNCFFGRFEQKTPDAVTPHTQANTNHIFVLENHDMRRMLRTVNRTPRNAAGPDCIRCWRSVQTSSQPVLSTDHCPTLPGGLDHSWLSQKEHHQQPS